MKFALYTEAALTCDLPEHRLRRGDIVKLVDHCKLPQIVDTRKGESSGTIAQPRRFSCGNQNSPRPKSWRS